MNDIYDDWNNKSKEWQKALEEALEGRSDVVTQYEKVAFAFPSRTPNPHSFDYPLIDQERLILWAKSYDWEVKFAPEKLSEEDKDKPQPVRFIKKA